MKNRPIIIVTWLLVFLNILFFVYIVIKQKNLSSEIMDKNTDYFYQARRQILEIEYTNESLKFPSEIYQGCDTITPCYQQMLEQVKHIFPDYDQRDDIIFLSNDLDFKLRDSYFNKQVYANVHFNSGLPFDSYNAPLLFLLNEDMKLDLVFVADKQTPDYTEKYLQIIRKRFFQSDVEN